MKFCILCIASVLFSISCGAQSTGVITYDATTIYSQEFKKMIQTSDGGFLSVASTGINGRISKMNSNYSIQWALQIDSMPFTDVVETNDGNYVFQGFTYKTDYPLGGVHILKTTPTGVILFQKMYFDPNNTTSVTAAGVAKGAGTDNGFVFFGGNCLAMQYITKCDANGTIQWQYSYAGTFGIGSICDVETESTGYTAAMYTSVNSVQSVGILKIDASGTPLMGRTMQSSNNTYVSYNCLAKLNNGDYFIFSQPGDIIGAQNYTISNSFSTISCNRVSNTSGQVTGMFATGNANDEVILTFVSYNNFYGGFIKVGTTGSIVVQNYSSNVSNLANCLNGLSLHNGTYLINGNVNNNRAMVAVVDEAGAGFCATQNPGFAAQQNYSFVTATPNLFSNSILFASATVNYATTINTYTSVNVCGNLIGISESQKASEISIYPNPFTDVVSIDRPIYDEVTLNMFDVLGRMVMTKKVSGTKIEMSTAELANGMYSLQLVDGTGTKVFQVAKGN